MKLNKKKNWKIRNLKIKFNLVPLYTHIFFLLFRCYNVILRQINDVINLLPSIKACIPISIPNTDLSTINWMYLSVDISGMRSRIDNKIKGKGWNLCGEFQKWRKKGLLNFKVPSTFVAGVRMCLCFLVKI